MCTSLSPYEVLLSLVMYLTIASQFIHGFIIKNINPYSVGSSHLLSELIDTSDLDNTYDAFTEPVPTSNQSPPIASLSLSGGGAYGAFQVGCLKALAEHNIVKFDTIDTISVGGLNGSFLAQYDIVDQYNGIMGLERVWQNIISSRNIYKHWRFSFLEGIFYRNGLYNPKPLERIIDENLDVYKLSNSNVDFNAAVANIQTGNMVIFGKNNENVADAVLAGCSIPIMFPPVKIQNNLYVDAGIKRYFWGTDLHQTIKPVVVITTSYNEDDDDVKSGYTTNMIGYSTSVIRVFMNSLYVEDMSRMINRDNVFVIRPREKLQGKGMVFKKKDILANIEIGYRQTKQMIADNELNIHALL